MQIFNHLTSNFNVKIELFDNLTVSINGIFDDSM